MKPDFASMFAGATLLFAAACAHPPERMRFGNQPAALEGTLTLRHFPTAPGYGENPNDPTEPDYILVLDAPIDVDADPADSDGPDHYPVTKQTEVQLIVRGPTPELTQREGKHVHVRGTFTAGITGHHHTEAMLYVTSLE